MIRHTFLTVALAAVAISVWVQPAEAQRVPRQAGRPTGSESGEGSPPEKTAASVADTAIRHLLAWQRSDARQVLDSSKADHAGSAQFKTASALLQAEDGQQDEALSALAQAAESDTVDPAPEYFRGEILFWKKKYGDAQARWQRAHDRAKAQLGQNPGDLRAKFYLAAALVRLQKYGDARPHLNALLQTGFDAALVRYQLGLSYAFDQKWQQAVDHLTAAIEADSSFAHAYYYRGLSWEKLGRTDNLLIDLDRFVKLAPSSPDADTARALLAAAQRP